MSHHSDPGIEIARAAAAEGLSKFQATREFYENNPDPNPRAAPAGGVALPGMGRPQGRPQPKRPPGPPPPGPPPGRPARPHRPGPRPRSGPASRPPRPGAPTNGGMSKHELDRLRKEAEAIAVKAMMEARADFIPNLFKGADVRYKAGKSPKKDALKAAGKFAKKGVNTGRSAKKAHDKGKRWSASSSPAKEVNAQGMHEASRLGKELFRTLGELDPQEFQALEGIISELAGDIFQELGSTMLPVIGTVKTGVKAGSKWAKTASTQHAVSRTGAAREKVIQGDPEKAVASVQRLLERERNVLATEAGMATAKLGADVAGYFVDLGVASGIATSAAEAGGRLALSIRLIVRDAREKRAANMLLKGPRLDAKLFEDCPLLGAYAVAGSNTSDLVGFLGGDPQRHGFTLDDLDRVIQKHQRPLVKNATGLISKSRLEVAGMTTDLASVRAKALAGKQMSASRIAGQVADRLKRTSHRA